MIVSTIQKSNNLCLQTNTQQGRATGHSDAEVALLWRPSRHPHLPLRSGCHANPLQPCLGPNTASSLAAVVTRGYFKCSLLSLPSALSLSLSSSHHQHHPPPSSPIPGTVDASSISPPAPLLAQRLNPTQDCVPGLPFITIS